MIRKLSDSLILSLYAGIIFLSAFLLFVIQPYFTRLVLPQLGGAAFVWSLAMVSFQCLLLFGYIYAHYLGKFEKIKISYLLHITFVMVALLFVFFAVPGITTYQSNQNEILWLITTLIKVIGLPFFILSTTAPLLQNWFSRQHHHSSKDPYFLYVASNFGSAAALLSYPFVIEPYLSLKEQATYWSYGYCSLVLLFIMLIAIQFQRGLASIHQNKISSLKSPSLKNLTSWLILAALPSALLISVTSYISTDVASVSFLWIAPLFLYLLTFMIVFSKAINFSAERMKKLIPLIALFYCTVVIFSSFFSHFVIISFHLLMFFYLALLCHKLLADRRPQAEYLTQYYIFLSLGGMIGGVSASLLAPIMFSNVIEYQLEIALIIFLTCMVFDERKQFLKKELVYALLFFMFVCTIAYIAKIYAPEDQKNSTFWLIIFISLITVFFIERKRNFFVPASFAIAVLLLPFLREQYQEIQYIRSLYAVHKLVTDREADVIALYHGNTAHGAMKLNETPPEPRAYYGRGHNFSILIDEKRKQKKNLNVFVTGLGVGSLACYYKAGDQWIFFEIDAAVINIANTKFNFLKSCAPNEKIILGDARLSIKTMPNQSADIIIKDAFSSDAIPIHLLTKEAVGLYLEKLKQDGYLVFHISNRYLELESILGRIAREYNLAAYARLESKNSNQNNDYIFPSHVVVMSREKKYLGSLLDDQSWRELNSGEGVELWTDDYANIFGAMKRKIF